MLFQRRENQSPVERYLSEIRLSSLLDGYYLANGVIIDQMASKEVLKEEMRRIERYLAFKEEMSLTRKLR